MHLTSSLRGLRAIVLVVLSPSTLIELAILVPYHHHNAVRVAIPCTRHSKMQPARLSVSPGSSAFRHTNLDRLQRYRPAPDTTIVAAMVETTGLGSRSHREQTRRGGHDLHTKPHLRSRGLPWNCGVQADLQRREPSIHRLW